MMKRQKTHYENDGKWREGPVVLIQYFRKNVVRTVKMRLLLILPQQFCEVLLDSLQNIKQHLKWMLHLNLNTVPQ
jgi:hypothetical protein